MENMATKNNIKLVLNVGDKFKHRQESLLHLEIIKVYTVEDDPVDNIWATCRRLERPNIIDEFPRMIIEDFWERVV